MYGYFRGHFRARAGTQALRKRRQPRQRYVAILHLPHRPLTPKKRMSHGRRHSCSLPFLYAFSDRQQRHTAPTEGSGRHGLGHGGNCTRRSEEPARLRQPVTTGHAGTPPPGGAAKTNGTCISNGRGETTVAASREKLLGTGGKGSASQAGEGNHTDRHGERGRENVIPPCARLLTMRAPLVPTTAPRPPETE
eukprot:gene12212-biopygen15479